MFLTVIKPPVDLTPLRDGILSQLGQFFLNPWVIGIIVLGVAGWFVEARINRYKRRQRYLERQQWKRENRS